jgi:hypothetical protein
MPKNVMINSDGFNDDPRTFMHNDTTDIEKQWSEECAVFMVQGLPWSAVARAATPCIAWQVLAIYQYTSVVLRTTDSTPACKCPLLHATPEVSLQQVKQLARL